MRREAFVPSVFQAIADPTRRQLLEMLGEGDRTVGELADAFEVTLSAISQHLRVLRLAGLVSEERQGRQRVYRLEPEQLGEINKWVTRSVEAFWRRRLTSLGEQLKKD
ncbi:MAG TPA: metalloregulator ArsR/SmtB family transcription factor [Thermoanaerobaculia bacterium]|jgi:DNA-binding transcriptional ArsR family regulator|nr:metalloregulator ArsR/SmtB family transcription factor [Thermoanaerobaculia bacterium]